MRVIYHNGRATPLRRPLWDTGQARRARLLRITTHTPHHTGTTIILHDGSKTAQRPLRCLRHYMMDCSARPIVRPLLLVPVTPDSGEKSVYPKPPTLSLCMDLIRQTRRQFRGVRRRTSKGLTSGISVNPRPLITRKKRYPCLGTLWHQNSLTTTDILSTPIIPHLDRRYMHQPLTRSRLVCAPSSDLHLRSRQESFVLRRAVPRLLLQRSFRNIF